MVSGTEVDYEVADIVSISVRFKCKKSLNKISIEISILKNPF